MNAASFSADSPLRLGKATWVVILLLLLITYAGFRAGVDLSATAAWTRPEYSHGLLVPFISAFLIWQRRDEIARVAFVGSWWGVVVLLIGVAFNCIGKLASLFIIEQYSVIIALVGFAMALVGFRAFRLMWVPLLLLLTVVPLPEFLYANLSSELQLISSRIGVWFIRLFGISVYLEGNVIDLGVYKLEVAEACNGLRYLFPLMTLGLIVAYFYKGALWKRVLLFVSSIPITILMNSIRIGTIGVMVEHWGIGMAEGFLHEFQGWAVFMASFGVLFLEMALLSHIGSDRGPWRALFGLEFPPPYPAGTVFVSRRLPMPFYAAGAVLLVSAAAMFAIPARAEAIPARNAFTGFPMTLDAWAGRSEPMEQIYLDALMLDDYLLANYAKPMALRPVNLYVAWYDSQRAGRSAHSPRSCLPGGGWEIKSLTQVDVPGVVVAGATLRVNRVLIQLGARKQLVYYWFQQRGRVVTNEYLVKWYMFRDSLTRNRTDGAMVRLVVPMSASDSEEKVERELTEFAAVAVPALDAYVPR